MIPESVTSIGKVGFSECDSLSSVTFGDKGSDRPPTLRRGVAETPFAYVTPAFYFIKACGFFFSAHIIQEGIPVGVHKEQAMMRIWKRKRQRRMTCEEYRERVKFTDDFFFSRVMQDLDLCQRMVEALLSIKAKSVRLHQTQRSLKREKHTHGIRLDVCLEDDERTIAVEMRLRRRSHEFRFAKHRSKQIV